MSKSTYVCLACRTSKRADAAYGSKTPYRCPVCQGNLTEVPSRWRIPKQADDDGWQKLQVMLAERQRRRAIVQENLSKIAQQIELLMSQEQSETRDTALSRLRWEKRRLEEQYPELRAAEDVASGHS